MACIGGNLNTRKVQTATPGKGTQSMLPFLALKGISAEFQVIRGFSQKIPADLLSYDKIHS